MTTKALTILGDADMAEDLLKRRAAEDLGRFTPPNDGGEEQEDDEDGENGN